MNIEYKKWIQKTFTNQNFFFVVHFIFIWIWFFFFCEILDLFSNKFSNDDPSRVFLYFIRKHVYLYALGLQNFFGWKIPGFYVHLSYVEEYNNNDNTTKKINTILQPSIRCRDVASDYKILSLLWFPVCQGSVWNEHFFLLCSCVQNKTIKALYLDTISNEQFWRFLCSCRYLDFFLLKNTYTRVYWEYVRYT